MLKTSFRRLAASHLPVNLYSARAQLQRQAAMLLHGTDSRSSLWEELDCRQFADDERGDRISLQLGGAVGGVALTPESSRGLLAAAGAGTLFLSNIEKLPLAAQHVLCRIVETGRYTPVGDPFPRPLRCRLIIATRRPLVALARSFLIDGKLADALGQISFRAEDVLRAIRATDYLGSRPGSIAAAS